MQSVEVTDKVSSLSSCRRVVVERPKAANPAEGGVDKRRAAKREIATGRPGSFATGVDSPDGELFPSGERQNTPGRGGARRQPVVGAALRPRPDRVQVRMRRGLLRRLHGPPRQPAGARVRDATRRGVRGVGDDDRGTLTGRAPAPGAAGVPGCRGIPVRLLHAGHGHGHDRPASHSSDAVRSRHRQSDGSQRLPLRHLSTHRPGGEAGGGASEERGRSGVRREHADDRRDRSRTLRAVARSGLPFRGRTARFPEGVRGARRRADGRGGPRCGGAAGVGPRRIAERRTRSLRVDSHRRSRARHRLHRQDRDRPEHQDVAGPGDRRRTARAADRGLAGDGGHRPGAVRPGNVRFPVDAADGAGTWRGPRPWPGRC